MGKVIRLKEADLQRMVKRVINEQEKESTDNNNYLDKIVNQLIKETTIDNPVPYFWLLVIPFKTYKGLLGDTMINVQVHPTEPHLSHWGYSNKESFYDICKEIYGLTDEECDYVFAKYNERMTTNVKEYFDTHDWKETGMVN